MPQKSTLVFKNLTAVRAQNFFGQLVQVLCVMQQEVVLQFVRLQPALTHKSLVTMLTQAESIEKVMDDWFYWSVRFVDW